MNIVEINIDGNEADYKDSSTLPVSFSVKTDKFFQVVGTDGTKVDNPASRLIFPPTKNNQTIMEAVDGLAATIITINGSTIFAGSGRPEEETRGNGQPLGYSMALLGGAKDLFSTLKGKTLRALELGNVDFTNAVITASWSQGAYDGTSAAVWPPVWYGYTGNPSGEMAPDYMRPAIYFSHILTNLWQELRVTVESQFFNTDFFKRMVYLFGVGEQWDVGGTDAQYMHVIADTNQSVPAAAPNPTSLSLPTESPAPYEDSAGIWSSTTGTCSSGDWTFNGYLSAVDNLSVEFVVNGVVAIPLTPQQNFSLTISVPTSTTFFFRATRINASSDGTAFLGTWLKASRSAGVGLGVTVSVASCLHSKKVTEFLAGISHLFNLAWHFNSVTRVLTVEPRLPYLLDGVYYDGFYQRLSASNGRNWTNKLDLERYTRKRAARPYGDWLILNNQPEESQYYAAAASNGVTEGVPFMGARFNFSSTGKDGQTVENPFFENLLISDSSQANLSWMPTIMEDVESGATQEPEPTYESAPKYAYWHGVAAGLTFLYNGGVQSQPVLTFKPRKSNINNFRFCVAFSDYIADSGTPQNIPGLLTTFYQQWLTILERGDVLENKVRLSYTEVQASADLFRTPTVLDMPDKAGNYIFLGLDKFQPLKLEAADGTFVEVVEVTSADKARVVQNYQEWQIDFSV